MVVGSLERLQAKPLLLKGRGLVEFAISQATHGPPVRRAGETAFGAVYG